MKEFDMDKELNNETLKGVEDYLKLALEDKTPGGYMECRHLKVYLDGQNKTVTCQQCKKILDPFWYLELLAKEWSLRRYQDAEAIKAYRALEQQRKNAMARGKCFVRPSSGDGQTCWDSYEALHQHPPEYVYYSGGWYAGEMGSYCELFDYIKMELARKQRETDKPKEGSG